MSGFIFDQGNLNIAALTVPGAYVQLMTPTGGAVAGPSNGVAALGTGSWGPTNQVTGPYGTVGDAQLMYGQFDVEKWKTDKYDLMRAVMQMMPQGQLDISLNVFLNRISDGTDTAATLTLLDTTSGTPLSGVTLHAKWTGTGGNTIKILVAEAGPANLYNVTLVASFAGTTLSETFLNIQGSTGASTFWANLAAAITNGNLSRGPSQLLGACTSISTTALNPATGIFQLSGGTDGRGGVTSASFFGSDVIGNRQGLYAFRGLPIVPAYVYLVGMTDQTKFANVQAFCNQEIIRSILPLPAGTSAPAAVALRSTLGISDKRIMYAKDHLYWSDPISGQTIFTDPVAFMVGRAASISPELPPLNKAVYGVVGSEHNGQYANDEIGLMNSNGIWVITNPCLGSAFWGIASASTTSLNPVEQPVEYQRLKDYIGIQFASVLCKFVGQKQGPYDPDNTRMSCKDDIDSVMKDMFDGGLIADWQSQCDSRLNQPGSISKGRLRAKLEYIPYWGIKFVILDLATSIQLSAGQALAYLEAQGGF